MAAGRKRFYSIGEFSKIMGVSVQTLRYYSSLGLVTPQYTNPNTGYRYYTSDQFYFIDKIKYLQKFRFSLEEIAEILLNNDIGGLVAKLEQKEKGAKEEIERLKDIVDSIKWYKHYYTYADGRGDEMGGRRHMKRRHMVVAELKEGESYGECHLRLNRIINNEPFRGLSYQRQFSFVLDPPSLLENKVKLVSMGIFVKSPPPVQSEHLLDVPEGDYFCAMSRILSEGWNSYSARLFFDELEEKPVFALASEYENNLYEYQRSVYEIQILVP